MLKFRKKEDRLKAEAKAADDSLIFKVHIFQNDTIYNALLIFIGAFLIRNQNDHFFVFLGPALKNDHINVPTSDKGRHLKIFLTFS